MVGRFIIGAVVVVMVAFWVAVLDVFQEIFALGLLNLVRRSLNDLLRCSGSSFSIIGFSLKSVLF